MAMKGRFPDETTGARLLHQGPCRRRHTTRPNIWKQRQLLSLTTAARWQKRGGPYMGARGRHPCRPRSASPTYFTPPATLPRPPPSRLRSPGSDTPTVHCGVWGWTLRCSLVGAFGGSARTGLFAARVTLVRGVSGSASNIPGGRAASDMCWWWGHGATNVRAVGGVWAGMAGGGTVGAMDGALKPPWMGSRRVPPPAVPARTPADYPNGGCEGVRREEGACRG